uniref:PremRNAsplicing factor ATPdependent RNA helicase put n=1 Tax=Albugo laibachii Nc14 TaxID=890382 RepID=F0W2G7_9STRA|nr:premRNAsplicing factor ATPdependent RNA helicase put [Albugo laibachii Nc14]|eukprot:CCA15253.1 premRNAsplicing factor ATPdependent RNA helicase put [Albugo laibachii Nc14]
MRHPSIWVIFEAHAKMKYKEDSKSARYIQAKFMVAERIPIVRNVTDKPIGRAATTFEFRNDVVGYFRNDRELHEKLEPIRELSQEEYLKKHEEKELDLLESQLKDEEVLFEDDQDRVDGYQMPESYEEVEVEGNRVHTTVKILIEPDEQAEVFRSEQDIWEDTQPKMAKTQLGAEDKQKVKKQEGDVQEYENMFEDHIEFISQQ